MLHTLILDNMEHYSVFQDYSYDLINFDESLSMSNTRHSAHCCIYCPKPFPALKTHEAKAYISMQMRFDGRLGFPGGRVKLEEDHSIVNGLNRELAEETNLDKKYFATMEDYCFTYKHKENNDCFHFFAKEVSEEEFLEIEGNSLKSKELGKEVFGILRVPLFTMSDQIRGFPEFLLNKFAGSAKSQLLYLLLNKKLASLNYIVDSLSSSTHH